MSDSNAFQDTEEPEDNPRKNAGAIVTDSELVALSKISRILSSMDDDGRQRALRWLFSRYGFGAEA